ncbi:MlaD family protein [Aquabacter spiritensis]|uniref:Phospholipid/cholesterol/gamma-HCH transport system substrate-binding protein n=1 Tax=Aquabacter spiritensis TaxID=933073 RepID=A0A4V2UWU3_9HYPH|nr:MlaD family protein [Aquabacter spiritensis]TCT01008.1 phospholipid/cholesterol/gamma-HCH transport system substrate-binding protein [Aquabacter spiritensis]
METRANYTLIGSFTLLVLVAAFGFIYWFMRPLASEDRKPYEIVYKGTVSGLRQGNAVTFNGIPVGQVTSLGLLPGRPSDVLVRIGVDGNVPILSDAKAGLESQGLTGIVAVSLRGGASDAKPIPPGPNGIPRIEADGGTGMAGLISTVQDVAGRVTGILDAIDPEKVQQIVANVETFSKAISDRSADVSTMIARANEIAGQLQQLATKADAVLGDVQKATNDPNGLVAQATEAAASVRKLADNLDTRTAELTQEVKKFTGPGMRQFEALASDGRRTLSEIDRTFRNFERNPRQFLFGGSSVPEYRR